MKDEWYYHMKFRDGMKGVTPILSALPPKVLSSVATVHIVIILMFENRFWKEKKKQHVGWASVRKNGQRAFGVTGAHHHKSWDQDDFRTCVLNAIVWTAKMEVPVNGVKSMPNPTSRQAQN